MRWIALFLLALILHTNLFANSQKKILILNSYHKGFKFSDTIIENIEKSFFPYEQIDMEILYMNSKHIYSRDYIKELSDLYALQLKNNTYDLIIAIDRFAYLFALKNYNTIFHKGAILFAGLELYSQELVKIYKIENKVNGIIEKVAIEDNIKLIMKMMPDLKKLYILNDRSPNGNDSSPFITKAILKIKDKVSVEYLRDDSLKEFIEYFSTPRENEAILFVQYSHDLEGGFYKTNEVATAISNFKLPVFVTDTLFMNNGVVGGKVISIKDFGLKTGKVAIDILYENIPTPTMQTNNKFRYIFDAKRLKDFKIKVPRGIRNIELINGPIGFFDKNRELINSVFLATPILIVVIFGLLQALYSKQQSAKKLKQRVKFDKVLLNSIQSPIFWRDHKGIILDANKEFCELIDIKYKVLQNHSLNKFIYMRDSAKKIIKFLEDFEDENIEDAQFNIKDSKGINRVYLCSQTIYDDPISNDKSKVTIFTDLTKEKEIEQERSKQTQYLIQQSKLVEIGEVFSSIAHQWKSPLVEVTALAQDLFYSQNRSEKEEDSYHINKIMVQVQYMTKTINDFQDFIMPSKQKTIFNVPIIIKSMLNIVNHNMKYNYIDITITLGDNLNPSVYGYENEFMQAILNIINNAKEALLNNSEKNRKINIDITNSSKNLFIDIIDNGPGISKESVDKIFLQYFSTKESGHGIGLYMTKLIIEDKMGGKIRYKKTKNGSCFRIKLRQNDENISS